MIEFDILSEGQRVIVLDNVHNMYHYPIKGKIKEVISPTNYLVESDDVYICGCPIVLTFHLLTESMNYEVAK